MRFFKRTSVNSNDSINRKSESREKPSVSTRTLTVEIEADGCVALAQFVHGCHFVLSSVLHSDIFDLQGREIPIAFPLNYDLNKNDKYFN